jgi:hypothetical protein
MTIQQAHVVEPRPTCRHQSSGPATVKFFFIRFWSLLPTVGSKEKLLLRNGSTSSHAVKYELECSVDSVNVPACLYLHCGA